MARPRGVPRIIYADAFRRLCAARDLVHDCYDEPLSLSEMAKAAGMSRHHFLRMFRDVMGVTPRQYLMRVRLNEARERLAAGHSVTEVCMAVGFASLGSFSSLFRREIGLSPRDYQRQVRSLIAVPADLGRIHVPHCFAMWFGAAT